VPNVEKNVSRHRHNFHYSQPVCGINSVDEGSKKRREKAGGVKRRENVKNNLFLKHILCGKLFLKYISENSFKKHFMSFTKAFFKI